ncbi:cation-translocating P-type ATPase [Nanoarchaeota archaeon]
MLWHSKTEKEVLESLNASKEGLTNETAAARLKEYGPNQIKETKKISPLKIFLEQFISFLIYILIAAAILSALLNHWLDFWVISAIIMVNAALGFTQQYKAEKAIQELQKLFVRKVRVMRSGKLHEILATELVPGDIIHLESGDKIAGDARLLTIENLEINEAVLTGESIPISKNMESLKDKLALQNRTNMLFAGTTVTRGRATAIVVDTGMSTEFGKIAGLLQEIKPGKTPFQKKLDHFSKRIGIVILTIALLISLFGIWSGLDKLDMFLTGVALAVSAIPEGMPAILALVFAISTRRMLKVNTLVRKLPAVEALGSVTTICVDKTGTLTAEEMTVTHLYSGGRLLRTREKSQVLKYGDMMELLRIGILCNDARIEKEDHDKNPIILGDPTEKALVAVSDHFELDKAKETKLWTRKREFSFTSVRKMMSIVREHKKTKDLVSYVKGAPEVILKRCVGELVNGKVELLTKKRRHELKEMHEKMESRALRTLAFAYKPVKTNFTQKTAEEKLIFVGYQGMIDPPRPEVKGAIQKAKEAGIRVIMITGDSPITAREIGRQVSLEGKVITNEEVDDLSDKELQDIVKGNVIFARVEPKHKLRVVEALKSNGEIVAVTGDGVNDVLALKRSDIGVAMGIRGTDVARDVSDIILLDDNFASIIKAIEEGRQTYSNTKKFTKYLLSANFSEMGIILYSILAGLPLPLLPLQILWINLVTDSTPALALGVEKSHVSLMNKKSQESKDKGILSGITLFIVLAGILSFLAMLTIFHWEMNVLNSSKEKVMTMVMLTSIMYQLMFVFTCRSDKSIFKIGIFSNKWIVLSVVLGFLLQILLLYTPLATAFGVTAIGLMDWLKVIGLGASGLIVFEAYKLFKKD